MKTEEIQHSRLLIPGKKSNNFFFLECYVDDFMNDEQKKLEVWLKNLRQFYIFCSVSNNCWDFQQLNNFWFHLSNKNT